MITLTIEEVERLQQIARDASSGAGFEERIRRVMATLGQLIPSTSHSAFVIDITAPEGAPPSHGFFTNRDESHLRAYAQHYRHEDPMGHRIVAADGSVGLLSDHVAPGAYGRDAFTGEYLPAIDLRHIMGVASIMPDGVRLAISLHREGAQGDFTAKEREVLRLVAPDITRAAFGSLLQEKVRRLAADGAPDASAGGLVFDRRGDIVHADPSALAILERASRPGAPAVELLCSAASRLVEPTPQEGLVVEHVLETADGGLIRARSSAIESRPGAHVLCTLEVLRPGSCAFVDTTLRRARLTAREREVAELATRGLGNRQIAFELGISPATVGVFLTHVYRKLNVSGRLDLARKLLGA